MDDENIKIKFNNYISKYINNDKINHAYLIETNYNKKQLLADELIKIILKNDDILEDLEKNYDLTVISTDSNIIKVEDIETLKEKFKTKSIYGKYRIYIIDGAEKLNDYASNKLLKFIEEPEDNIIAILLTENKNKVLSTIVSRCISFRFIINDNKFVSYDEEYISSLFDFVLNIEKNREKAIAYQDKYDIKKMSDRKYLNDFFNNLLYIYDDVIKYKIEKKVDNFSLYIDKIKEISDYNDFNEIRTKINAINTCINRMKYNPNIKLLLDKLIILMTGVELDA